MWTGQPARYLKLLQGITELFWCTGDLILGQPLHELIIAVEPELPATFDQCVHISCECIDLVEGVTGLAETSGQAGKDQRTRWIWVLDRGAWTGAATATTTSTQPTTSPAAGAPS
jgi:hypothetical protein